jgi:subtilase family protein/LGFP repeat-containing protein
MTAIQDKFEFLRAQVVDLGEPLTEEEALADGGARQAHQFGTLYFHPRIGEAFECHGLILTTYVDLGQQDSGLGYPVTDETDDPSIVGGRRNDFEGGSIVFDPAVGITVTHDDLPQAVQVVVKVTDDVELPIDRGGAMSLADLGAVQGLGPEDPVLAAIFAFLPEVTFTRLFEDLDNATLDGMVSEALLDDPEWNPPRFGNYLVADCPDVVDPQVAADALQTLGIVLFAYPMPVPSDPAVVGTTNPLFVGQGYLGAAPTGVGVQAMWARGADGSNSRFVDLEQGWLLTHDDLPPGIPLLAGINSHSSFPHGCAVLGEIVGVDNSAGIVGMAPAALPRVISYFERAKTPQPRIRAMVANRIAFATQSLRRGDVLLLEVQIEGQVAGTKTVVPVETDVACRDAIRLATRLGVIVVEAAGNGTADLDQFVRDGRTVLRRGTVDFEDSGAIMVGGCTSAVPHTRFSSSNFGSRIDCCAWAENILTTGNPATPDAKNGFWSGPFFGGTSGASPIIVGLILLIQDLQLLLTPKPGQLGRLGPGSIRAILANPANGTPTQGTVGSMPDGAKIIANEYVAP